MKHKGINRSLFRLVSILFVIGLIVGIAGFVHADTPPAITTDQTKYSLGDTMVISGIGFTAGGTVNIEVLRPDHEIDSLPSVTTDGAGNFQTSYTPPIIPGRYKITVTDGTNIAKTAATEADVGNMQLVAYSVDVDKDGNLVGVNWGRGNSAKGWIEGAWYPIILKIPNAQVEYGTNLTSLPGIYISYDFYSASGGKEGVYADMVRSIQIGVTNLDDGAHDSWGWPQANGTAYPSANLAQVRTAQTTAGENAWIGFTLAKTVGLNPLTQVNLPVTPNKSELGTPPGTTTDAQHQFMVTGDQYRWLSGAGQPGHQLNRHLLSVAPGADICLVPSPGKPVRYEQCDSLLRRLALRVQYIQQLYDGRLVCVSRLVGPRLPQHGWRGSQDVPNADTARTRGPYQRLEMV